MGTGKSEITWRDAIREVDWIVTKNGMYKEYPYKVQFYYKNEKIYEDDFRRDVTKDPTAMYNFILEEFKEGFIELDGKTYDQWREEEYATKIK